MFNFNFNLLRTKSSAAVILLIYKLVGGRRSAGQPVIEIPNSAVPSMTNYVYEHNIKLGVPRPIGIYTTAEARRYW